MKNIWKRIMSLVLTLMLVLRMMPGAAAADTVPDTVSDTKGLYTVEVLDFFADDYHPKLKSVNIERVAYVNNQVQLDLMVYYHINYPTNTTVHSRDMTVFADNQSCLEQIKLTVTQNDGKYTINAKVSRDAQTAHTGGSPTCVTGVPCSVCGIEYTDPDKHIQSISYVDLDKQGHKAYYPCCQTEQSAEVVAHDLESGLCPCGEAATYSVTWTGNEYLSVPEAGTVFGKDFVTNITVPANTHLKIAEIFYENEQKQWVTMNAEKYSFENGVLTIPAEHVPAGNIKIIFDHFVYVKFDANGGKISPEVGFPQEGDNGFSNDGSYWIYDYSVGNTEIRLYNYVSITREGFRFMGTWKDTDGNVYDGYEDKPVMEDITLYAMWECTGKHNIDANGKCTICGADCPHDSYTDGMCDTCGAKSYGIQVGATIVNTQNASDVLGDGSVSYDADTGTLTLNNATVDTTGLNTPALKIDSGNVTLALSGENTLVGNRYGEPVYDEESESWYGYAAIEIGQGASLTVSGWEEDTLFLQGDAFDYTMMDHIAVLAAVSGSGDLTVSGGTVTAKGISLDGNYVQNGGNVDAYYINAKNVTVSGGVLVSSGDSGIHYNDANGGGNFGICALEDITISGGDVTAIGARLASNSDFRSVNILGAVGSDILPDGLRAGGSVTVSGGKVTASGSNSQYRIGDTGYAIIGNHKGDEGEPGDGGLNGYAINAPSYSISENATFICGTDNSHHYSEATCQNPATCGFCGESYGELAPHTQDREIGMTCRGQFCTVCRTWYGLKNVNNHYDGALGNNTPVSGGMHTAAWSCCGATVTEYCEQVSAIVSDDGAACTERCNDCGAELYKIEIVAPEHKTYGDGKAAYATIKVNGDDWGQADIAVYYRLLNNTAIFKLDDVPTAAGEYKAEGTWSVGDCDVTLYVEYEIAKAEPIVTAPQNLMATYGQTLADITLSDGWAWNNPDEPVGTVGTQTHKATFTPTDTANYKTVEKELAVTVICNHTGEPEFRGNDDGLTHNGYCAGCGEPLGNYVERPHSYDTTTHICICGKVEEFTVSWSDGDSGPYENSYEFGEIIVIPTNELFQDTFRKGGYRLVGWEGYTEGMTMPAEPLTFTAIYAPEAKLVPETPDGENGWYRYAAVCASDGYVVSASEDGAYGTDIQIPNGEYEEIVCWLKRGDAIYASEVKLSVPGLKVDGTAPTIVETEVASLTETTATIRAAVEDNGSGVASVTLILAPTFSGETDAVIGTFADGAVTVTGMQPGSSYRFYLNVKDNAGNLTREVITLTTPDCPSAEFHDLEPDAWYHEAADFVLAGGMMQGYGNGTFGPEDTLSRAMVVEILYNLQGRPQVTGTDPYTDTEPGQWYTDAVLWATQEGIALGYGGGKFGPLDPVTREQIAVFFHRYACLTGQPTAVRDVSQFPDAEKISDYARTAMGWAVENGLFIGDDTGHLRPVSQATRAEMAIILKRHIAGTE